MLLCFPIATWMWTTGGTLTLQAKRSSTYTRWENPMQVLQPKGFSSGKTRSAFDCGCVVSSVHLR